MKTSRGSKSSSDMLLSDERIIMQMDAILTKILKKS